MPQRSGADRRAFYGMRLGVARLAAGCAVMRPMTEDRGGPAQPLRVLRNLKKHLPILGGMDGGTVATVRAADGVACTMWKGRALGIVGESRRGKSTTARLPMRLLDPDTGEMVFEGEPVSLRAPPPRAGPRGPLHPRAGAGLGPHSAPGVFPAGAVAG